MKLDIAEPRHENKYLLDGIQFPIHCVLMNVDKRQHAQFQNR